MDGEIVKRPVPETGWIKGFTAVDEVDEVGWMDGWMDIKQAGEHSDWMDGGILSSSEIEG